MRPHRHNPLILKEFQVAIKFPGGPGSPHPRRFVMPANS